MNKPHQRSASAGTSIKHATIAGTARIRAYVNTLGRLISSGCGAARSIRRTTAFGMNGVNGVSDDNIHSSYGRNVTAATEHEWVRASHRVDKAFVMAMEVQRRWLLPN